MTISQDLIKERAHYDELYQRDGAHHFIGGGYEDIHQMTVETLDKPSHILDIGCGAGHHALSFAQRGYQISGIELSQTAVGLAHQACREQKVPATISCGDVRHLPFKDQHFDASFLSLILHHFLDYKSVLREAARVSKHAVFVFEPNAWNPQSFLLLNVINPVFRPSFLTPNQRAVDPDDVKSFMKSLGFQLQSSVFRTVGSTQQKQGLKKLIYNAQKMLPQHIRHNKFIQIYHRSHPS